MKPCPECGKTLEDDPDWEYCPFCGTTLNRKSNAADWRWIGTFETLGEGAYIADELKSRGIVTRLREQTATRPPYFVVQAEYVLDVAAESFDAATDAIAAIRKRDALDEDAKDDDTPPSQSASRQTAFMMGLIWILIMAPECWSASSWASHPCSSEIRSEVESRIDPPSQSPGRIRPREPSGGEDCPRFAWFRLPPPSVLSPCTD